MPYFLQLYNYTVLINITGDKIERQCMTQSTTTELATFPTTVAVTVSEPTESDGDGMFNVQC